MSVPKKPIRKRLAAKPASHPYEPEDLPASVARDRFADTLNRVTYRGERVVIRRHGKGVAAVVPMKDYELLQRIEDEIDLREARKALVEYRKSGGIPLEKVIKRLGLE